MSSIKKIGKAVILALCSVCMPLNNYAAYGGGCGNYTNVSLEEDAAVNATLTQQDCYPLHTAAKKSGAGLFKVTLRMLLKNENVSGTDREAETICRYYQIKNQSGNSLLHTAVIANNLPVIQHMLATVGFDPNGDSILYQILNELGTALADLKKIRDRIKKMVPVPSIPYRPASSLTAEQALDLKTHQLAEIFFNCLATSPYPIGNVNHDGKTPMACALSLGVQTALYNKNVHLYSPLVSAFKLFYKYNFTEALRAYLAVAEHKTNPELNLNAPVFAGKTLQKHAATMPGHQTFLALQKEIAKGKKKEDKTKRNTIFISGS